jgi:hypothetical protein
MVTDKHIVVDETVLPDLWIRPNSDTRKLAGYKGFWGRKADYRGFPDAKKWEIALPVCWDHEKHLFILEGAPDIGAGNHVLLGEYYNIPI